MARLTRDFAALRRSFQVSQARINVLVEGRKVDGYLYDKVCGAVLGPAGVSYRIIRGDEIGGGSGGKQVLLGFFHYLKRSSALEVPADYTTLFFLDKDLDDLEHRLRRSPHIHYTQSYDIENLVVENADLRECSAAAMSLPVQTFMQFSPTSAWCVAVQEKWAAWIALCLCARSLRINLANYASPSQVNVPLHGEPDPVRITQLLGDIVARTGLPPSQVRTRFLRRRRMVEQRIKMGRGSQVFKGKWYLLVLSSELGSMAGGPSAGVLRASLQTAVLQQADPMEPCFGTIRATLSARASAI